jgi:hypothetical protein
MMKLLAWPLFGMGHRGNEAGCNSWDSEADVSTSWVEREDATDAPHDRSHITL